MPDATLKITNSGVPAFVPEPNALRFGVIALNWADSILYFKNSNGQLERILPQSQTGVIIRTAEDGVPIAAANGTLILSGMTGPAPLRNGVYLPVDDFGGFPQWSSDGSLGSTGDPPRFVVRKSGGSWEVLNTDANQVMWSYYDYLNVHPTPFTVPPGSWIPANGTGTLVITAGGASVNGSVIGQLCRVGDVSPYDWYRWDGTAWNTTT